MQTETSSEVAAMRWRVKGEAADLQMVSCSCFSFRPAFLLYAVLCIAFELQYNLSYSSTLTLLPKNLLIVSQMLERLRVEWFGISVLNKHLNSQLVLCLSKPAHSHHHWR